MIKKESEKVKEKDDKEEKRGGNDRAENAEIAKKGDS